MGVGAGFAAFDGHTPTSVRTRQVEREIQIEEVAPERRTVRGLGGEAGTVCQDLVRARPGKRELGLEHLGVGVRLHTLADGGGRVAHPCPTTHSEVRCRTQRVYEGGVSAVNTRNGEGVVCPNNVVRALLPVGGQVAIIINRPGGRGSDAGAPTTPLRLKTARGRRGSLPMWTSLGARPVAALTELL